MKKISATPLALAAVVLVLVCVQTPASAQTGITGTLNWDSFISAPYPIAWIGVHEADASDPFIITQSSPNTGAFSILDMSVGTYDVYISAGCWQAVVIEDVEVTGTVVDLGTLGMSAAGSSPFNSITMVGDFNSWNTSADPMTAPSPCGTYKDTLNLAVGTYFFKFVTNGEFENPYDYGGSQSVTLTLPGTFGARPVGGGDTALKIAVNAAGDYIFSFDMMRQQFTAEFQGTLPEGTITGTVAFAGFSSAPFPQATVKLFASGSSTPLRTTTSDATTRDYTFDTVADGNYDLEISSPCFTTETRSGIVVSGAGQDVGETSLTSGGSAFTTVQLVGDFNGWDLGLPSMNLDDGCVWSTTVSINAGTFNMKFVGNGSWDTAYGGNETPLDVPGAHATWLVGGGTGNGIKIVVAADEEFFVVLDEVNGTFTFTPTTPVEPTTWGRIKSRY